MRTSLYLVISENIIGLLYLISFLIGFFWDYNLLYLIGGVGMVLYNIIINLSNTKNIMIYITSAFIITFIVFLFGEWQKGLFWHSFVFCIGNIPGFIKLISSRNFFNDIEGNNKVVVKEFVFLLILIIIPYLIIIWIMNIINNEKGFYF